MIIKKYKYNGTEYDDQYSVRKAILEAENKIFPIEPDDNKMQFWKELNVEYKESEYIYSNDELADQIRNKRDRLLQATDYYVMPDYPADSDMLLKVKYYRMLLRDITKQPYFPKGVYWPQNPLENDDV